VEKFASIRVPFTAKTPSEFTSAKEPNLIKLSCDKTLKTKLGSIKVFEFWLSVKEEYPPLSPKLNGSQFNLRSLRTGANIALVIVIN